MEESKFAACDILDQLFNDEYDFSGSDSNGKEMKMSMLIRDQP